MPALPLLLAGFLLKKCVLAVSPVAIGVRRTRDVHVLVSVQLGGRVYGSSSGNWLFRPLGCQALPHAEIEPDTL